MFVLGSIEKNILEAIDAAGYYIVPKKEIDALFKREASAQEAEVPKKQIVEAVPKAKKAIVNEKHAISIKHEKAREKEERALTAIIAGKTRFKDIAAKSKVNPGTLNKVLVELIKAGKVQKIVPGKYGLAGKSKPVKTVKEDAEDEELNIEEDEQDVQEAMDETERD